MAEFETIDEIPYDTLHDGQHAGALILLKNEQADLLFSEQDRSAAANAINERTLVPSLFERLNRLYTEGNSAQAKYFLSELAELELVKAEYTIVE